MDTEDEDLWVPFLAARPRDQQAERLRAHLREDERRGQRHAPRRAAALSQDEIVRTAIRVADAEGADAVSMRRIARELNAGTMSLYWHIVSKEELLDLMQDTVQGDQEDPEPSGDWRRDMREVARSTRREPARAPVDDGLHRRAAAGRPRSRCGTWNGPWPTSTGWAWTSPGHRHRHHGRHLRHGRRAARGAGAQQRRPTRSRRSRS